ncbi:MAG: hypothetical protein NVSMB54_20140 [Ktedonobacteraceae bacterium]
MNKKWLGTQTELREENVPLLKQDDQEKRETLILWTCCPSVEQVSCCQPSEKAACCDTTSSTGCGCKQGKQGDR